jgi:hypothetical protein
MTRRSGGQTGERRKRRERWFSIREVLRERGRRRNALPHETVSGEITISFAEPKVLT